MYNEQDYSENRKQMKKRATVFFVILAVALAVAIVSFIYRIKWLTIGVTIVGGGLLLFLYSMYLYPVRAYGRHLRHVLHGKQRETTGTITSFEVDAVERDGVFYHPLTINVGDKQDEEDERLFYYDRQKTPFPWATGDFVTITAQEKLVAQIVRAAK